MTYYATLLRGRATLTCLSVPRMPSMACDQHFDAWTRARRASGRTPEGSRNCAPPP